MPGIWATDRILATGTDKDRPGVALAHGTVSTPARGLLHPVRMSGDRLVALRLSDDNIAPDARVALDPRTHEEVPYLSSGLPSKVRLMTMTDQNDIVVQNGRLFFGFKAANGPADAKTKQWSYLVLGTGSSAPPKS